MKDWSITVPHHPNRPEKVVRKTMEILFEYFDFGAVSWVNSQDMIRHFASPVPKPFQCNFVIESSHSATHFVPFFA